MCFKSIYIKFFLFVVLLTGTFTIKATVFISEIRNNTDQFLRISCDYNFNLYNTSKPVCYSLKTEAIPACYSLNPKALKVLNQFGKTEIYIANGAKVCLTGLYLPSANNSQYLNRDLFNNAISLDFKTPYSSQFIDPLSALNDIRNYLPFAKIRENMNCVEMLFVPNLYQHFISSKELFLPCVLEINQVSKEVYFLNSGGCLTISEDAFEIIVKEKDL